MYIGNTVLLLFALGKTTEDLIEDPSQPDRRIPKHGPSEHIIDLLMDKSKKPAGAETNSLRQHFCFAVDTVADVEQWEQHLHDQRVPITGRMLWSKEAYSVYFSDPDGHVGEVASRGLWPNHM